jgi:hypothetical protein
MTKSTRGVPVRLPDGTTRPSIIALARELGCRTITIRNRIIDHRDGHAILDTLPDPRYVGRHGGAWERKKP